MKKLVFILGFSFLPFLASTQTIAKVNVLPFFEATYIDYIPLAFGLEHYIFPKYSFHAGINKQDINGGGGLTRNGILYYRNEMHGTKFTLEFRRYTKSFEQRKFGSFFVGPMEASS